MNLQVLTYPDTTGFMGYSEPVANSSIFTEVNRWEIHSSPSMQTRCCNNAGNAAGTAFVELAQAYYQRHQKIASDTLKHAREEGLRKLREKKIQNAQPEVSNNITNLQREFHKSHEELRESRLSKAAELAKLKLKTKVTSA